MQFLSSHNHSGHDNYKKANRRLYVYGLTGACGAILVGLWIWSLNSDSFNITRTNLSAFAPDPENRGEVREAFKALVNPQGISEELDTLQDQQQEFRQERQNAVEDVMSAQDINQADESQEQISNDMNVTNNNDIDQLFNNLENQNENEEVILEGLDVDALLSN